MCRYFTKPYATTWPAKLRWFAVRCSPGRRVQRRILRDLMRIDPSIRGYSSKFSALHPKGMCFLSHRYKFIYYNIPKSASTTLKRILVELDPEIAAAELRSRRIGSGLAENHFELPTEIRERYFKFAFVRDPVDRFLSAFDEIRARAAPWARRAKWFNEDETAQLDGVLDGAEVQIYDGHIERQLYFVSDLDGNPFSLDFLGRVENFECDWRRLEEVLGLGRSEILCLNRRAEKRTLTPTKTQLERIQQLYWDDYTTFGYDPVPRSPRD